MKDINDLKSRLKTDEKFKNLFTNKESIDDLIKIAQENGYDVTEKDLKLNKELSEDALELVAGGKKKNRKKENLEVYEHYIYS